MTIIWGFLIVGGWLCSLIARLFHRLAEALFSAAVMVRRLFQRQR